VAGIADFPWGSFITRRSEAWARRTATEPIKSTQQWCQSCRATRHYRLSMTTGARRSRCRRRRRRSSSRSPNGW